MQTISLGRESLAKQISLSKELKHGLSNFALLIKMVYKGRKVQPK